MHLLIKVALVIIFSNKLMSGYTQDKNNHAGNPTSTFSDLPIGDASNNSILLKNESASEKIGKNIFIKAATSKTSVFLGEPILLSYYLYTALNSQSRVVVKPGLTNFTSQETEIQNDKTKEELLNGKIYRVFLVWQAWVSPFQAGAQTIDPISLENTVEYRSDDKKDHQYSGTVQSKPLNLMVMPLPENGKPAGFPGNIGTFSLQNSVAKPDNAGGESNTLIIEIEGTGNFNNIALPEIIWPAGTEPLPIKETFIPGKNKSLPEGKKVFEIPFISNQPGSFTIPSQTLSYFDPQTRLYKTAASNPIQLLVKPGSVGNKRSENKLPATIEPLTDKTKYIWPAIAGLVLISIYITARTIRNQTTKNERELEAQRMAAAAEADRQIKTDEFNKILSSTFEIENNEQFSTQIKMLLIKLMQERLNSDMPLEENLIYLLSNKTNDLALINDLKRIFDQCENILYSPSNQVEIRNSIASTFLTVVDKLNSLNTPE